MKKHTIKILVLNANGYCGWKASLRDTVLQGVLGIQDDFVLPPALSEHKNPIIRKIAQQFGKQYDTVSYALDWQEAICSSPHLNADLCNINNMIDYQKKLRNIKEYELILILHSTNGGNISSLLKSAPWLRKRHGKLAIFIGNEYSRMNDKIAFIQSVEADYICSQLPLKSAQWLYRDAQSSKVLSVPHALNPNAYYPQKSVKRNIDIGFRGYLYHNLIGDMERTNAIKIFQEKGEAKELLCDIQMKTISRELWATFLNSCKGIIGAESGTYYLTRDGKPIAKACDFLKEQPDPKFDDLFAFAFQDCLDYVSGKAISSRHFEPIGTKTCQILVEGDYNGILNGGEHYIKLNKDLSNIEEAIQQFKDETFRNNMVEQTYNYVMDVHTHKHRIAELIDAVS